MWLLCAWDVGIKIREYFPERCPRFERSASLVCFTRPTVFRKKSCRRHVRTARLKFEHGYARFGKIKVIVATVKAAQNDVTHHGMAAGGVFQLPNASFCFGTESGYLLRSLTTCQQNCG